MAIVSAQTSIGTTATAVLTDETASGSYVLLNPSGNTAIIYIGGSGVTTGNGFPLAVGAAIAVDVSGDDDLYGRVAAGTQTLAVLRTKG